MIELKDIKNCESILLVEEAKSLQITINNVLKALQGNPVVYISLIKPYSFVLQSLKKNKTETDKIFFIDCITELAGGDVSRQENVLFIREPTDLTGLKIAIDQSSESIPGEKWMILDALRVLTIYNKEDVVLRFVQSVLGMTSSHNAKIVIMATKGKDEGFIKKASQFFEKVVEGK